MFSKLSNVYEVPNYNFLLHRNLIESFQYCGHDDADKIQVCKGSTTTNEEKTSLSYLERKESDRDETTMHFYNSYTRALSFPSHVPLEIGRSSRLVHFEHLVQFPHDTELNPGAWSKICVKEEIAQISLGRVPLRLLLVSRNWSEH